MNALAISRDATRLHDLRTRSIEVRYVVPENQGNRTNFERSLSLNRSFDGRDNNIEKGLVELAIYLTDKLREYYKCQMAELETKIRDEAAA